MSRDPAALADTTSYENRAPGQASFGQVQLGPLAVGAKLARFTVIAEHSVQRRGTWFKQVEPDLWNWFSQTDHTATQVCSDVAMSKNCVVGKILGSPNSATSLTGMNLSPYGYTSGSGDIHMRLNADGSSSYSAICSCVTRCPNCSSRMEIIAIIGGERVAAKIFRTWDYRRGRHRAPHRGSPAQALLRPHRSASAAARLTAERAVRHRHLANAALPRQGVAAPPPRPRRRRHLPHRLCRRADRRRPIAALRYRGARRERHFALLSQACGARRP